MNGPLRIVHTEASCGWGGQEIRILEESAGMIARGYSVHLLCPSEAPILAAAHARGIPATALAIGRKRLGPLWSLRRWLVTHEFDVINTHSSTDSWLAAIAARTLGKPAPVVRTRHISAPVGDRMTTRWLYTHGACHVVTTGEALRASLIRENGIPAAQLTSVPTGIDEQRFAPASRAEARAALGLPAAVPIIGIVATLRDWKGHSVLIEALARLRHQEAVLLMVGDGPYRPSIEAAIARHGVAARVIAPGNQQDVRPWLHAMDIFALPSWANEGVPQGIMQAMLCGLPVVSTPIGSIEEAVLDGVTGRIVPPRDAETLARVLDEFLDDPVQLARYADAGRAHALANFTLDHMLDRMESIFRAAVAGR